MLNITTNIIIIIIIITIIIISFKLFKLISSGSLLFINVSISYSSVSFIENDIFGSIIGKLKVTDKGSGKLLFDKSYLVLDFHQK